MGGVWRKVGKGLHLVKLKSDESLLIKKNLCSIVLDDIITKKVIKINLNILFIRF